MLARSRRSPRPCRGLNAAPSVPGTPGVDNDEQSLAKSRSDLDCEAGRELLAQLLRCGHQVLVSAHGNSMSPAIKNDEQVLIAPLDNDSVRRVMYCHSGALTHPNDDIHAYHLEFGW
jgi:hypothetical protein